MTLDGVADTVTDVSFTTSEAIADDVNHNGLKLGSKLKSSAVTKEKQTLKIERI